MNIKGFEDDFQAACLKHDVNAAFVLVSRVDEKGSMLAIGGSEELSDYVERILFMDSVEARGAKH